MCKKGIPQITLMRFSIACCCCLQIDTFTHMSERVTPHLNSPRSLIVVKIVTGAKRRFIDL